MKHLKSKYSYLSLLFMCLITSNIFAVSDAERISYKLLICFENLILNAIEETSLRTSTRNYLVSVYLTPMSHIINDNSVSKSKFIVRMLKIAKTEYQALVKYMEQQITSDLKNKLKNQHKIVDIKSNLESEIESLMKIKSYIAKLFYRLGNVFYNMSFEEYKEFVDLLKKDNSVEEINNFFDKLFQNN